MAVLKALLLTCIPVFLCCAAFAQTRKTDSLERVVKTAQGNQKVDILNQLTYEYITHDNDKVVEYGRQAIELSKKINYPKGEATAYCYRGVYEYQSGQFPESHRDLHHGLKLAQALSDRPLTGYALLQLGNCSLEEVQNDSALYFFKQSYEIFKDSTDPVTLSKLYRNIGSLYGQRYQADSQRLYLDRAIRIRRLLPNKTLLADALILDASIAARLGDFPAAKRQIREAEAIVSTHPEDEENRNDIRHIKALILFQQGDFKEAFVLFDSARNYYFRTALLRKYVSLLADIGKVFSDRGEYELALNNLYEGLRLGKQRGFVVETSIIRNRIGWVNFHLGDSEQALRIANEGLSGDLTARLGERANLMTLKGVVLSSMKKHALAEPILDSVLLIYKQLGNARGMSEAFMNLGSLKAGDGNYPEAIKYYQSSIQLAKEIPYTYGLAWCYYDMGNIYLQLGDYKMSAQLLDLSEQLARQIGANEVLILNYNSRRDLLKAQHRFEESLEYSIRANQLKDSIHRTEVTRRFLNLEKIQEIEDRDRDIRLLQKDKLLAEDKIHLQEARLKQQSILLSAGVIGLALLAALAFVYYRFYSRIKLLNVAITEKNTRIQAQADKLQEVNLELKHLYKEVSEQKEKIQAQANALTESNRSISDINRSLEILVEQKTQELRTTNEELVKHNSELLQFSYTVSHNLRGPVARLLGLSDLIQSERDLNQAKQWISLIGKTTSDLDQIIKDLSHVLDLRNMPHQYREKVTLEMEWQQSRSLLQDSLNGTEEIVTHFTVPELITVRPMLQSIFYNLLSNAIKYRSPERNLRIIATSQRQNGNVILEIADNGLGFDTQLHGEKLFKLYKRFHTHVEGRGLGLYLIKSQIEVLHGTIEVESIPDKGTMFRVTLPLSEDADALPH